MEGLRVKEKGIRDLGTFVCLFVDWKMATGQKWRITYLDVKDVPTSTTPWCTFGFTLVQGASTALKDVLTSTSCWYICCKVGMCSWGNVLSKNLEQNGFTEFIFHLQMHILIFKGILSKVIWRDMVKIWRKMFYWNPQRYLSSVGLCQKVHTLWCCHRKIILCRKDKYKLYPSLNMFLWWILLLTVLVETSSFCKK